MYPTQNSDVQEDPAPRKGNKLENQEATDQDTSKVNMELEPDPAKPEAEHAQAD